MNEEELENCVTQLADSVKRLANVLHDYMDKMERETNQIWEYVLRKKEG